MTDDVNSHGNKQARDAFDRDDDLRALLAASDPASSLPPADPAGVARLLEDIMIDEPDLAVPLASRRRNPFVWVAAAAAAVLVVGLGAYSLSGTGGAGDGAVADEAFVKPAPTTEAATGSLTLSGPAGAGTLGGPTTRCASRPTAQQLALRDIAFKGTVTSVADGVVTLEPEEFYVGKPVATVKVEAPFNGSLGEGLVLKKGLTYLISATDGQVSVCGFSGLANGGLGNLYQQTFN